MAAPSQVGQEWKIGYGATAYTGYMPEDATQASECDEEIIKDENNATCTVISYDARATLQFTFLIKSTGSITPPTKNSTVSLTGPNDGAATKYRVTSSSVAFSRGISKLSLSLIRETSMASVYDA